LKKRKTIFLKPRGRGSKGFSFSGGGENPHQKGLSGEEREKDSNMFLPRRRRCPSPRWQGEVIKRPGGKKSLPFMERKGKEKKKPLKDKRNTKKEGIFSTP